MGKNIKNETTVLVWNGVPYSLVREEEVTVNCPCQICDLRNSCNGGSTTFKFIDLCMTLDNDDRWFFKTDTEIANKRVIDYFEFYPE